MVFPDIEIFYATLYRSGVIEHSDAGEHMVVLSSIHFIVLTWVVFVWSLFYFIFDNSLCVHSVLIVWLCCSSP